MKTFRVRHDSGKVQNYSNSTDRDWPDMLQFLAECGYVEIEIDGVWFDMVDAVRA